METEYSGMRRNRCIGGHERPWEYCPDSRHLPRLTPVLTRAFSSADNLLRIVDREGEGVAQREEDRRLHPRFQCSGKAEMRSLSSGARAAGQIENLSLGGCRILIGDRHNFREGENVEMTFCVRQLPLRVQASVRQAHAGNAVCVAFTLLTERGKGQLLALIDELAEILRDQVDSLIQYQSSLAAAPAEQRDSPGRAKPAEKRSTRRPVPIDRNSR